MDVQAVQLALAVNVVFTVLAAITQRLRCIAPASVDVCGSADCPASSRLFPLLQDRVELHFEYLAMEGAYQPFGTFASTDAPQLR
jgi:hypothetical protein